MPEEIHEIQENAERAHEDPSLVPVTVTMATLAVLVAAVALLGHRAHTEELLNQTRVTDTWAEYQAESLKAHLYEVAGTLAATAKQNELGRRAGGYRAEQGPLRAQARHSEAQRDEALAASLSTERRKASLDVAVALYEIAIVLTSVAALTKQPWLIALAALLGLVAVVFDLRAVVPA